MKISNTLKKVVVISIFCSQVITLYPMQEVINPTEPRQTRGLSLMSMDSQATLPKEESILSDPATAKATRQMRLKTLFYGEGDTVINIPGQYQDEENPANLDEVTKVAISQDTDKDSKAVAQQQERKASLAARLSEVDAEIDDLGAKDLKAQSTPGLQAKIEKIDALTQEAQSLQNRLKEKGKLYGSYALGLSSLLLVTWSVVDQIRDTQTLPFAAYVVDAATVVLAFIVQSYTAIYNRLKKEETDLADIEPSNPAPVQTLTFRQRLQDTFSNGFNIVKSKAVYFATTVALVSAIFTIVAEFSKTDDSKLTVAAQWMDNIETILEGLLVGGWITTKVAINKIYAQRAKREARIRGASADGSMPQRMELPTLPDRRSSAIPQVQVQVISEPGITMVANPLTSAALETDRDRHESDESPTDTDKNSTPEKRDSSEKTSQASSVQVSPAIHPVAQQLDFIAETEPIPTV